MNYKLFHLSPYFFYEANQDGGQSSGQSDNANQEQGEQQQEQGAPVSFASFDAFYNSLSDDQKKIVDPAKDHFERMQNTVRDTRTERDGLSDTLKAIRKKFGDNADVAAEIDKVTSQLDIANKKSDFYEQAVSQECRNPKAAFALAAASDLFTRTGAPDWKAIKEQAPELFGTKTVRKATAGNGTNQEPTPAGTFNDWIRKQAGVDTS